MKRYALFLLLLFVLPISIGQAQGEVTAVNSIILDFWPDYDQTAVLVLLDGELPAGTSLPTTLTIPLPETASFNAAAYRDAGGNMMNIEHTIDGGNLTLTTPALNFRVEYYLPYNVQGDQRSFSFTWLSDFSVTQFEAKVQQPITSENFATEPQAIDTIIGQNGLTYQVLASQALPANQPFAFSVNYDNPSSQLSANQLNDSSDSITIDLQPAAGSEPTTLPASNAVNWPLIAGIGGGVLVIAALVLLYFGNQPKSRVRKPRPVRGPSGKGSVRFCHNCGEAIGPGDRFCRQCGTPVKGK